MSLPLTTTTDPTTCTPDAATCNRTTCNDPTFILADHLGSTSITTDVEGNLVSEIRYNPWGEVRHASGLTPTGYTYTDQYSYMDDPTTAASEGFGLMFYNARWYDPGLGRFAQADTIIPEQTQGTQAWDRYAGMNNNPVRYTDPTGHFAWLPALVIGGALIGSAISYGTQVYNNYQSNGGDLGAAMTQNIDGGAIVSAAATGAMIGLTVAVATPVVVGMVGEGLMGASMLAGSAEVFGAGMATYQASIGLQNLMVGIPNSASVCRGGTCQASQFKGVMQPDGTIDDISVNSAGGASLNELTMDIPNKQVGVATAGQIRAAGGTIYPSPYIGHPYHATINGLAPEALESLFTPTITNPTYATAQ